MPKSPIVTISKEMCLRPWRESKTVVHDLAMACRAGLSAGEESKIMSVIDDGRMMLTALQVREMTGVPWRSWI